MDGEKLDLSRFDNFGIVKNEADFELEKIQKFQNSYSSWKQNGQWTKEEIVAAYRDIIPELTYEDKGKYLDQKM